MSKKYIERRRKNEKRVLSFVLVLCMVLSIMPMAFAQGKAGLENFKKTNEYVAGQFEDVGEEAWYAKSIKTAYELALMNGKSQTAFTPLGNVTVVETIVLACRLNSIYNGNDYDFTATSTWYDPYVSYAIEQGIISEGQYTNYDEQINRADFAVILANSVPAKAFAEINEIEEKAIPDVSLDAEFYDEVYLLYRAGILTGNDKSGTYTPMALIERCAVAAIITRIADESLRQKITLEYVAMPTAITLDKTAAAIKVGESFMLAATLAPSDATSKEITWTSSDPKVASVVNGQVKGLDDGSATITATTSNGLSATCEVTVSHILLERVDFKGDAADKKIELEIGDTYQLEYTIYPANATDARVSGYLTSHSSIVQVSDDGEIKAVGEGTTSIGVVLAKGEVISIKVTVKKAGVKIVLKNSLPKYVTYSYSSGKMISACQVTGFSYTMSDYTHQIEQTASIYFQGEKTYDKEGNSYSSEARIGWKMYDDEGYVIDSGNATSPDIKVGEKFKNAEATVFDLIPGKTYVLELLDIG